MNFSNAYEKFKMILTDLISNIKNQSYGYWNRKAKHTKTIPDFALKVLLQASLLMSFSVLAQDKKFSFDVEKWFDTVTLLDKKSEFEVKEGNKKSVRSRRIKSGQGESKISLSEFYKHFEDGVLFENVEQGLDMLWGASFKKGRPYKENLGFFTPAGLLILPNEKNEINTSKLCALPLNFKDREMRVLYQGIYLHVLGIIHTHPSFDYNQTPTPNSDFQFGFLGIHNYVMCKNWLFDAYDPINFAEFKTLGRRDDYHKLPSRFFLSCNPIAANITAVYKSSGWIEK
jgi:hypothetical protein